ncbi:peptide deformylase, partial [Vibrio sp. FNV 38]|nr:peptide deformylase [Vibrio sp. FNV 38]
MEFRKRNGFGRAIAAPQCGFLQRYIALCLPGRGQFFVVNPRITWSSPETFTMLDDCLSFPDLLVRVRRHCSISIEYQTETGERKTWNDIDQATAGLLQQEIDHLDGVLAVDRALPGVDSIIWRSLYEA